MSASATGSNPDPRQAEELFAEALAMPTAARGAFLASRCGADETLRREVESLLAHHDADASFLEQPAPSGTGVATSGRVEPESTPGRVGPYRVHEVLGEGGMGVVYRAEQDSPRRLVALKVIRGDWTSGSARRRFEQEGAALARLQHPGIAQVFETGIDPATGRSFLAMELIEGQALSTFAAALGTRAKLGLIAQVCDAVHHAHQRGVVHRDLKPGNVIVDRSGRARVLDFGVAALVDDGTVATMHTRTGELIGTVAYMSPEQIGGDAGSVDTRSDIYSLGVILYELLAGKLPHDVRRRSLPEALRMVRESDPTRLSTIARGFRGDVETIVRKAMERDPGRRYASAAEMGADIRRHLADEPIMARPPSAAYQIGKLARRYKALFVAGGVVIVTLVAALTTVSAALVNARRAEAVSRSEAERAATVSEFIKTLLTGVDPSVARGKDTALLMAILADAERRAGELAANPVAEVEVRAAIGQGYITISRFAEAASQLERAVEIGRADLPRDHVAMLNAQQLLGSAYDRMDRREDARRVTGENVEAWARSHGERAAGTLLGRNNYGKMLLEAGEHAEAESQLRRAVDGQTRTLGLDHADTLRSMSNLASLLSATGRWNEAEGLFREVLERRTRVLGEDHPETLIVMGNLGHELSTRGRKAEAEPLLVRALEVRRRVMGDAHLETLVSMYNVAGLLLENGRVDEAAALAERLVEQAPSVLGEAHGLTGAGFHMMGKVRRAQKRFEEAYVAQLRALEGARVSMPAGHPRLGIFACAVGRTCIDLGRFEEAERMLSEGRAILLAAGGPGDASTLAATEMMVDLSEARRDGQAAARWRAELEHDRAARTAEPRAK
ncbi:MAG: tetratricopeptide repeat protein [Phycisphaerales bacterium]